MALADGVVGSRYIAQSITWTDDDGTAVDLSGSTLAGFVRPEKDKTTRAIDGSLTADADQVNNTGVFTWAYGAADVAAAGDMEVQFVADYGALDEKTILMAWHVHEGLST